MKSISRGKPPGPPDTHRTPLAPAAQTGFTVLSSGVSGWTALRQARKLTWGIKCLVIQAFGKSSHELMDFLLSSSVRWTTLSLSYPKPLPLDTLRAKVTPALPALWPRVPVWAQPGLWKECCLGPGPQGLPASSRPSTAERDKQRWGRGWTLLLTVYWPQTALSLRGFLLPWQREESEEGTAPGTSGSEARWAPLTAKRWPCRARKRVEIQLRARPVLMSWSGNWGWSIISIGFDS